MHALTWGINLAVLTNVLPAHGSMRFWFYVWARGSSGLADRLEGFMDHGAPCGSIARWGVHEVYRMCCFFFSGGGGGHNWALQVCL